MPALRVRGPYLAMVTIAFGFVVEQGAVEWRDLTGGGNGLILSHAADAFRRAASASAALAVLGLLLVGAALFGYRRIAASGWGYAMRAVRDSRGRGRIDRHRPRLGENRGFRRLGRARRRSPARCSRRCSGFVSPSSFPFFAIDPASCSW